MIKSKAINPDASPKWTIWQTFAFRAFALYLILYYLFISYFGESFPFMEYVNGPLQSAKIAIGRFAYQALFHQQIKGRPFLDSYNTYMALLVFLLAAILISIVWTILDKGKRSRWLFKYMHVFARYYIVIILSYYALSKLLLVQGFNFPFNSLQPITRYDPSRILWSFLAASKGYQFFGGLMRLSPYYCCFSGGHRL
jgi:hypothetical protein